jgi:ActR/RegA family two-component response regulator
MDELRILVVEDDERWQEELERILHRLGNNVHVDIAANYELALRFIAAHTYDLATVDLALRGDVATTQDADQLGLELLRELRNTRYDLHGCGLIMLTAYGTIARTSQAVRDYNVDHFLAKADFDDRAFLVAAREAIRNARLRGAVARATARYRLIITLGDNQVVSSELAGPDRRAAHTTTRPPILRVEDLVRRTDDLNMMLLEGKADRWRPEARSIGDQFYRSLIEEPRILGDLTTARNLAPRPEQLWVQFSGPPGGLGLPFELLRDEDIYLGLSHILTRRLLQPGPTFSRKPEPFHAFVEGLLRRREPLRALIVGANSDGSIPKAEQEASALATEIRDDLDRLAIPHEVRLLVGQEASYAAVRRELGYRHYHLLHYAGHGRFTDKLPEISGLMLHDDEGPIAITAADLNLLAQGSSLHLVSLSCCLGARTSAATGRGDFRGVAEALVRADVPFVLGHRWTVADDSARALALTFYRALWRSFSPGEALLEARRAAAMGQRGRDDETWMAPVLLAQNI